MKRIILIAGIILGSYTLIDAQQAGTGVSISFDKEVHDFGRIYTNNTPDGKVEFKIYNKGTRPLILTSVRACCGTVVREFTSQPIAPNDSGVVRVELRVFPQPHKINRTVTIQSNAENRQTAILRITGEVVEPPDSSLRL